MSFDTETARARVRRVGIRFQRFHGEAGICILKRSTLHRRRRRSRCRGIISVSRAPMTRADRVFLNTRVSSLRPSKRATDRRPRQTARLFLHVLIGFFVYLFICAYFFSPDFRTRINTVYERKLLFTRATPTLHRRTYYNIVLGEGRMPGKTGRESVIFSVWLRDDVAHIGEAARFV